MDLAPLRILAGTLTKVTFGVSATVTRPAPDHAPVTATVIWVSAPKDEAQPFGSDLSRRGPRRVLAIDRSELDSVPRGTLIVTTEQAGGATKTWRVDGVERVTPAFLYLIVVAHT